MCHSNGSRGDLNPPGKAFPRPAHLADRDFQELSEAEFYGLNHFDW